MRSIPQSIESLAGWRRFACAAVGGALSVLSLAPFFWWPVLFLTVPLLVWLIDGALASSRAGHPQEAPSGRARFALVRNKPFIRAAAVGWWFGLGYFMAGLFWVGEAFLVEAEKFAVLLPAAVTLLPAGLALFWAAATAAASYAWQAGLARILTLALTLAIAVWLRGHVFTGFPWNVLGYALTYPLELMQSAALLGIYGLSLLVMTIAAAPLVLLHDVRQGRIQAHWRFAGFAVALVPLAVMWFAGAARLSHTAAAIPSDGARVRIVQPSVPQREKWRPENQGRIFDEHITLSLTDPQGRVDAAEGIKLIVWPEAAMPFLPLQTPAALSGIGRMLPPGAVLLSGALRLEEGGTDPLRSRRRVFNSLLAFGAGGQPIATYDKIHLVPFGEYLPFQRALESIGLEQLTRLRGGFTSGPEPRPLLALDGLPRLGPLICYEAIFPREVVAGPERPEALVNVTNDGWFGNTTGPRQHLHQARVRAVEEGLPVLRAANNGISAIIDASGRTVASLGLNEKGVIDGRIPAAVSQPLYARLGDWLFLAALVVTAALRALLGQRNSRR
jgi:apolipoprotein N-acyltransferase